MQITFINQCVSHSFYTSQVYVDDQLVPWRITLLNNATVYEMNKQCNTDVLKLTEVIVHLLDIKKVDEQWLRVADITKQNLAALATIFEKNYKILWITS